MVWPRVVSRRGTARDIQGVGALVSACPERTGPQALCGAWRFPPGGPGLSSFSATTWLSEAEEVTSFLRPGFHLGKNRVSSSRPYLPSRAFVRIN